MAPTATLLKDFEQIPLLSSAQMKEVRDVLAPRCADPAALLKELVRRDWLTEFQAKAIHKGQASQLVLGPYLILDGLGKGGVGQIFKARHTRKNLLVALKVLHRELINDQAVVQRFHREIEVASHVLHPNIVRAYEAGPMGGSLVLAMEYVQGINLEKLVERSGPLPVGRACDMIRQAAEGLAYAQERGLVHRDIKPSNLLVDSSGVVKILDLGLARLQEYTASSQTCDLTLRESKAIMQGTPDYMAPEQALDFHLADTRSDIYSLGCTLFFLLAGKPPFSANTLAEKLMKHQQLAPPIDDLRLEGGLARVLRKMLAKRAQDRYQQPGEVVQALRPYCGVTGGTQPGSSDPTREFSLGRTRPLPLARRLWQGLPLRGRRTAIGAAVGLALIGLLAAWLGRGPAEANRASVGSDRQARQPPAMATALGQLTSGKVVAFSESFQSPTPAPGWRYLWNQKGHVGNPDHYVPLSWCENDGLYNIDGMPGLPRPTPGYFLYLRQERGHPGQHADGYDRCAIAAYTIQPADGAAPYYLIRSAIGKGNNLRVIVHVNNQPAVRDVKIPANPNPPANFDTHLGRLKPGDTIYVAVGADGNDGRDTFEPFDFTIYRGLPPESERPLVPRSTTNAFEYPDLLGEVAPGFSVGGLHEGRLHLQAEHRGRKRVVATHPQSGEIPCILSQRLRIPTGRKTVLVIEVSNHPEGDFQLIVNASGQTLLDEKIGNDTTKDGWAHFEVNLTPFAGREVTLEVFNSASGWQHEWAYWGKVAVESR